MLCIEEVYEAENNIWRLVQKDSFGAEIKILSGSEEAHRWLIYPKTASSNVPPFTHTGTDCFGPFLVKKGRSNLKRYGVIFTCLVTRAIHIEVVESMETDFYINAFRRFIARRGPVTSIRSDNGTNLVGAEKELRKELEKLKHSVIAEVMLLKGVTWQFNPPHASHFGGVWERQIRTIRRVLRGLCHQQVMTDDTLHTLFCEERQKWTTRQRNLKVGDIVLSLDNKLPRGSWPLGRVLEVISDADGHCSLGKSTGVGLVTLQSDFYLHMVFALMQGCRLATCHEMVYLS
ncbi:hypothetical protein C7M84_008994 [Penaeus vannamei]|uniref:Integrase catalytic domain-containing protein n=1 Tax=Penaeus vannamei TaxID=6689 RepID=A0A423T847_PENVA|nr:hypothetical protein C7M84_008994 [Penaeus vannamei]